MTSLDSFISDGEEQMKRSIEALTKGLQSVRTGRANAGLVENIIIDQYNTQMPLNQLASITIGDARTITIEPWDKTSMEGIEKGILKADIGLSPTNDGRVIRLPIPPLTEERRSILAKEVRKKSEDGRIAIRNTRRKAIDQIRQLETAKGCSKDESFKAQEKAQHLTDSYVGKLDALAKEKEKDVMSI